LLGITGRIDFKGLLWWLHARRRLIDSCSRTLQRLERCVFISFHRFVGGSLLPGVLFGPRRHRLGPAPLAESVKPTRAAAVAILVNRRNEHLLRRASSPMPCLGLSSSCERKAALGPVQLQRSGGRHHGMERHLMGENTAKSSWPSQWPETSFYVVHSDWPWD